MKSNRAAQPAPPKSSAQRMDANAERRRRKLDNRRNLLAAARQLFVQQGVNEITTHDIAEMAGVVHGTFYNHFKDKTDCYHAFIDDVEEELCQVIEWFYISEGTPFQVIKAWVEAVLSYSDANPGVMKLVLSDVEVVSRFHERPIKKYAIGLRKMALLDDWKRAGVTVPEFDNESFIAIMKGVMRHLIFLVHRSPEKQEEAVTEMTRFLARSIGASEK